MTDDLSAALRERVERETDMLRVCIPEHRLDAASRLIEHWARDLQAAQADARFERGEHALYEMRYEMAVRMRTEVEARLSAQDGLRVENERRATR
jgi:hypothetical protein